MPFPSNFDKGCTMSCDAEIKIPKNKIALIQLETSFRLLSPSLQNEVSKVRQTTLFCLGQKNYLTPALKTINEFCENLVKSIFSCCASNNLLSNEYT